MTWSNLARWIKQRRQGLYLRRAGGAAPVVLTLLPTFALMQFGAVYQAAVPGIAELGGTLDPASAGAAVALSNGNLTATFSGVGSVRATADLFIAFTDTCWEFVVPPAGSWGAGGVWTDGSGVAYNANAVMGGNGPESLRYNLAGVAIGSTPGPAGPALVAGDVLGVVWISAGAGNQLDFYVNGVLASGGGSTIAVGASRFPTLSSS